MAFVKTGLGQSLGTVPSPKEADKKKPVTQAPPTQPKTGK